MRALISRLLAIVGDRGGILASLRRALREPVAVMRAAYRIGTRDWRRVVAGSGATAAAHAAEFAERGLINDLNRRLAGAFDELQGACPATSRFTH